MKNEPFVIERTYNAPVERVWKAITDKETMKQWYFEIAEFEPVVGFEFTFEGKDNDGYVYVHLCKITEVVPNRKLQHTWTYEGQTGQTVVTMELFAEGDKTRFKLTHEGLETLPNLPAFARENFVKGWTAIIGTSLKEFVEESTFNQSIELETKPEQIWKLITTPSEIRSWAKAFMEGTYAESDFKPGSEITWYTADGAVAVKGIVTGLDAPKTLELSYYDDPSQSAPMQLGKYQEIFRLEPNGNKTYLSIEAGPLPIKYTKMHAPMWDKALSLIKEMAEEK